MFNLKQLIANREQPSDKTELSRLVNMRERKRETSPYAAIQAILRTVEDSAAAKVQVEMSGNVALKNYLKGNCQDHS